MKEPFWINEQMAQAMHDDQIAQYGGLPGLRDENLLAASLARPQNLYAYGSSPTLFDLAAAYGYGLAKNHPFVDGNKRAAFVVMATFLRVNGYGLDAPEMEVVLIMERLADDQETQESIAEWLSTRCAKL